MSQAAFIENNKERFLQELFDLLRIPSISADSAFAGDVRQCAESVAAHLRNAGADNVSIEETSGHPIVYGEKIVNPAWPTVLIYGHYDVQPRRR
jgi:acetylornithine deacetylase/succinyl-diaminopimelate desuccinylase-like protein